MMLKKALVLLALLFVEHSCGFTTPTPQGQQKQHHLYQDFNRQLGKVWSSSSVNAPIHLDVDMALAKDLSSEETTATTTPALLRLQDRSSYWTTFRRRLSTKEDFLGLHKVSSVSLTLSAIAIAAVGFPSGFQDLSAPILSPLTGIMLLSALLQLMTSFPMGLSHRRAEPVTRSSFMFMATTCLGLVVAADYVTPFCPNWLADPVFSKAAFFSTSVAGVAFSLEAMKFDAYMSETESHDERLQAGEKNDVIWLQNAILGYLPIPLALLLNLATVVFAVQIQDRDAMMDFLQEHSNGDPDGLRATLYYSQVYAAIAVSFAPLIITLRDKRLMSSSTLMIGNAFLGVTSFGVEKAAFQGLFEYITAHPLQ